MYLYIVIYIYIYIYTHIKTKRLHKAFIPGHPKLLPLTWPPAVSGGLHASPQKSSFRVRVCGCRAYGIRVIIGMPSLGGRNKHRA